MRISIFCLAAILCGAGMAQADPSGGRTPRLAQSPGPQSARVPRGGRASASEAWAGPAIRQLERNGILAGLTRAQFRTNGPVSHAAAAIALARMAARIEERRWKAEPSVPVPEHPAGGRTGAWKSRIVTGGVFASALARIGNYIANGVPKPHAAHPNDLARSVIIAVGKVGAKQGTPAYTSLQYLARRRAVGPDSPLLKGDSKPITAGELSVALAQWVDGVNDRMTELMHDKWGDTIDAPSIERERRERGGR